MIPTKKDQKILADWMKNNNPSLYELIESGRNEGRAYLTDITHRNYEATKRRGLITNETHVFDFFDKIEEENNELFKSIHLGKFDPSELAKITLTCFAMAEHYGIDLIEEMRKKTEFNETRP